MSEPPCPSWSLYRTAVFLFEVVPEWAEFGIVTACNPLGESLTSEANAARDDELRRELEHRGLPVIRVRGCSPDLDHQEPGWAAPISRDDTVQLGNRFGQDAVFWISSGVVWLISCPPRSSAMEPLGPMLSRVAAG